MNSVLISIQPKWCELIASGKKILEVRKTRPKIKTPFKVYIYQTKKPVSVIAEQKWTEKWGKNMKCIFFGVIALAFCLAMIWAFE